MQIVPRPQTTRIQKMIKKYKEFQYNLAICTIVYTLFYKNKKIFFIFFKPWYNWYKLKKIVIPTLIRSFLYPRAKHEKGTILKNGYFIDFLFLF